MKKTRRKFTSEFKAQVAISALQERSTLSELALKYEIHSNQITKWKKEFLEKASTVFESSSSQSQEDKVDVDHLYSKIGRLEIERDFLKKNLTKIELL